MTDQHLTAGNVVKSFGDGEAATVALQGVDLQIDRGDFVAIMGPSGSGKSTLLYCLSGMDQVTKGTVTLHGDSANGHSDDVEITALNQKDLASIRLTRMGFVFQQVHLLRNLTILDNIVLSGVTATPDQREQVVARARELLDRTGIGELADLFGDEPTGALNAATATEIMDLLAEINDEGRSVIIVTHDANVAARARRVIVLRDGLVDSDLRREASETDESWSDHLVRWLTAHGT